jgi:hypothetical protein
MLKRALYCYDTTVRYKANYEENFVIRYILDDITEKLVSAFFLCWIYPQAFEEITTTVYFRLANLLKGARNFMLLATASDSIPNFRMAAIPRHSHHPFQHFIHFQTWVNAS